MRCESRGRSGQGSPRCAWISLPFAFPVPQIFVFTGSTGKARSRFTASVEQGIPLTQLMPHISRPEVRKRLAEVYPAGRAFCWAGRSRGRDLRNWAAMGEGDLILGYQQGSIRSVAFFVEKFKSESLALAAWPDTADDPFDLVYFFSKPHLAEKPLDELAEYFGSRYQGLMPARGSKAVIEKYGTYRRFAIYEFGMSDLGSERGSDAGAQRPDADLMELESSAVEGRRVVREHLDRERNSGLVKDAKAVWRKQDPRLRCACCEFSFTDVYGEHGAGFIEAHHIVPLAEAGDGEREVKVKDLAPVCSNCHRMLHRNGVKSIEWLKDLLRGR